MGCIVSSTNSCVAVLTPGPSECHLLWRQGLYGAHHYEVMWALIQHDCIFVKGKLEANRHGEHHVKVKEKVKAMLLQAKEHQNCQHTIGSYGRGIEQRPPTPQVEPALPIHWFGSSGL